MPTKPAKILSRCSHIVSGKLRITEWFFEVPRDHTQPEGRHTILFARSARKHELPADPTELADTTPDTPMAFPASLSNALPAQPSAMLNHPNMKPLPWLVYLQGGPGMECRSPQNYPFTQNFLDKGYEMLYLDQRGTGHSMGLSAQSFTGSNADSTKAANAVNVLKGYRADNIVRDCEAIRLALTKDQPDHKKKWSTIGQSFGGFVTTSYLSMHPEGLRECFIFGGLPPLVNQPDEVYKRTFKKLVERNKAYYTKYPEDEARVKKVVRYLIDNKVQLPSGELLQPRRFLAIGLRTGMHGGLDTVHEIVLKADFEIQRMNNLTRSTLDTIAQASSFDNNILYAILHEPIYCQGHAANWSADRVLKTMYPGFDPLKTLDMPNQPVYFTGEMIFPWMFEEGAYDELPKLKNVAHLLANDANWPQLYDRKQLARNTVPVYAAVYMEDMYVDFGFSMETAAAIKGCKVFVTNVLFHNAVAAKMEEVVEQVWKLRCDTID